MKSCVLHVIWPKLAQEVTKSGIIADNSSRIIGDFKKKYSKAGIIADLFWKINWQEVGKAGNIADIF